MPEEMGIIMDCLKTAQAHALRKAMVDAREVLDEVYEKYQRTLEVVMDAGRDVAVRQEGPAFAAALTRYSEAAMAWLLFADAQLRPKKAGGAGG